MLTSKHAFYLMWLFIVFVSTYDGCLVLANRPAMWSVEQNPVGRWLIHAWGDDIWLLLAAKATGTVCAAALLLGVYWTWPRVGWIVCAATAFFQLILLLFLYLA